MIRLLAVSPSGEAFFTRDQNGRIWRHPRLRSVDPVVVSELVVERAVVDHGYHQVDVEVDTWAEVDAIVRRHIATVPVPDLPINPAIAHSLLPVLDRWLRTPSEREFVVPLVTRLLTEDSVGADADLRHALLERASAANVPVQEGVVISPSRSTRLAGDRYRAVLEYLAPSELQAA